MSDLLRERLSGNYSVQAGNQTLQAEPLRRVYASRNYEPIWTGSPAADGDAKLVLNALRSADSEGLRTQDYAYVQLAAMSVADDSSRATFELLMTDTLLRYARNLRAGRARSVEVESDAGLPSIGYDYVGALSQAAADGSVQSFLADLPPVHHELDT